MKFFILVLLQFFLFLPLSLSFAQSDIFLPVPASDLELNYSSSESTLNKKQHSAFEVAVSSWSPSKFSRPTYESGSAAFDAGAYPLLSLNRVAPIFFSANSSANSNGLSLFSKFGVATAHLERTVYVPKNFGIQKSTEGLTLLSLRFGLEFKGPYFVSQLFKPYVGLAILPTLAVASRSELEGEVNEFGWPLEALAGVEFYPPFLREDILGFKNGSVGLGGHYILGTIAKSKMDDLAAQIFFRVEL